MSYNVGIEQAKGSAMNVEDSPRMTRSMVFTSLINYCVDNMNMEANVGRQLLSVQWQEMGNQIVEMAEGEGYSVEVKTAPDGKQYVFVDEKRRKRR